MNFNHLIQLTSKIEQNPSLVVEAYSEPGFKNRVTQCLKNTTHSNPVIRDFYTDDKIDQIVTMYTSVLDRLNKAGKLPVNLQVDKLGKMYQTLKPNYDLFSKNIDRKLKECNLYSVFKEKNLQYIREFAKQPNSYGKFELPKIYIKNYNKSGKAELSDDEVKADTDGGILALRDEKIRELNQQIQAARKTKTDELEQGKVPKEVIRRQLENFPSKLYKELEKYNQQENETDSNYIKRLTDTLEKPQLFTVIKNQITSKDVYTNIANNFLAYLNTSDAGVAYYYVADIIKCLLGGEVSKNRNVVIGADPKKIYELFSFDVYNAPYRVYNSLHIKSSGSTYDSFKKASTFERRNHKLTDILFSKLSSDFKGVPGSGLPIGQSEGNLENFLRDIIVRSLEVIYDLRSVPGGGYRNLGQFRTQRLMSMSRELKYIDASGVIFDYIPAIKYALKLHSTEDRDIPITDKIVDYLTENNFALGEELELFELKPTDDLSFEIYKLLRLTLSNDDNIENKKMFDKLYNNYPDAESSDPTIILNTDKLVILRALSESQAINARVNYIEPITKQGAGCQPPTPGYPGAHAFGWCISSLKSNAYNYYRYSKRLTPYFIIVKPDYFLAKKLQENPGPPDETPDQLNERKLKYKKEYCEKRTSVTVIQASALDNFLYTDMFNQSTTTVMWSTIIRDIPELDSTYAGNSIKSLLLHILPGPNPDEESNTYSTLPYTVKNYNFLLKRWMNTRPGNRFLTADNFLQLKSDDVKRFYIDTRPHDCKIDGSIFGENPYSPYSLLENTPLAIQSRKSLMESGNKKYLAMIYNRFNNYPNTSIIKLKQKYNDPAIEMGEGLLQQTPIPTNTIYEMLPQSKTYVTGIFNKTTNDYEFTYIDDEGKEKPIQSLSIYQPTKEELAVSPEERQRFDVEVMQEIYKAAALIKFIETSKV